jgi:hypothetical protein
MRGWVQKKIKINYRDAPLLQRRIFENIDKIQEIGRLGKGHGFVFDDFRTFRKPVSEENLETTKRVLNQAA